ncbi:MAG: nucleotide sugar dehydrogenase, partial [Hymenobacter sp.]
NVDIVDPHASSDELLHEYGFRLTPPEKVRQDYDAVIVAVSHKPYMDKDEAYFQSITAENAVLVDIKGLYRAQPMHELHYWSL